MHRLVRGMTASVWILFLAHAVVVSTIPATNAESMERVVHTISVHMPNISLLDDNNALCVSARIPSDLESWYITKVDPHPDAQLNGDLIVNTCEDSGYPGSEDEGSSVLDCSLNDPHTRPSPLLTRGEMCANGGYGPFFYNYLSASGDPEDASLRLPQGLGVPVGGKTAVNYLVLNIHYFTRKQGMDGYTGSSYVNFTLTKSSPQMQSVRTMALEAMGFVGPQSEGSVTGSWTLRQEFGPIRILAVTGHSHTFSVDFWFMIERTDGHREIIVRQDPRSRRQTDVSDLSSARLDVGDKLLVKCLFNNTLPSDLKVGTGDMCVALIHYTGDWDLAPMPPFIHSMDERFADCFSSSGFMTGDEVNGDASSSYIGSSQRTKCGT